MFLQQLCRANGEVGVGGNIGDFGAARDCAVVATREVQRVTPVEQLEHRLQRVISVRQTPGDVQEEVQLRWSETVAQRVVRFDHESLLIARAGYWSSTSLMSSGGSVRARFTRLTPVAGAS